MLHPSVIKSGCCVGQFVYTEPAGLLDRAHGLHDVCRGNVTLFRRVPVAAGCDVGVWRVCSGRCAACACVLAAPRVVAAGLRVRPGTFRIVVYVVCSNHHSPTTAPVPLNHTLRRQTSTTACQLHARAEARRSNRQSSHAREVQAREQNGLQRKRQRQSTLTRSSPVCRCAARNRPSDRAREQ